MCAVAKWTLGAGGRREITQLSAAPFIPELINSGIGSGCSKRASRGAMWQSGWSRRGRREIAQLCAAPLIPELINSGIGRGRGNRAFRVCAVARWGLPVAEGREMSRWCAAPLVPELINCGIGRGCSKRVSRSTVWYSGGHAWGGGRSRSCVRRTPYSGVDQLRNPPGQQEPRVEGARCGEVGAGGRGRREITQLCAAPLIPELINSGIGGGRSNLAFGGAEWGGGRWRPGAAGDHAVVCATPLIPELINSGIRRGSGRP